MKPMRPIVTGLNDMTNTVLILTDNDTGIQVSDFQTSDRSGHRIDPVSWLENHGNALYSYALLRVREPSTAEDLVQDTLLAALKSVHTFQGKSTERTWLTGILKHKILDHLRKSMRKQPLDEEIGFDRQNHDAYFDETDKWAFGPADWDAPDSSLEKSRFWDVFNDCVSRLPERLRLLYILREFDDLETNEILKTLQITSRNNLWTMLSRARLQLRQCLELNWFAA